MNTNFEFTNTKKYSYEWVLIYSHKWNIICFNSTQYYFKRSYLWYLLLNLHFKIILQQNIELTTIQSNNEQTDTSYQLYECSILHCYYNFISTPLLLIKYWSIENLKKKQIQN